MRAAGPETAAVAPFPRRPSFVPSLKFTDTERDMLGLTRLPAIDGRTATDRALEPQQTTACPANPTGGPTASAAKEDESGRLPGTADDLDDAATAAIACTPTSSFSMPPPTTMAAPLAAYVFELFRGRWHYGQPVLARYRTTPNFYSGNIATYLGAGLFMVVFDDGTLDYRVKREDLMIVRQAEPDVSVDPTASTVSGSASRPLPLDASTLLAPPNQQLMVDFSANPPRQVLLPVDGGYGDRQEDEQDEFYARYPGLCASDPTIVSPLREEPAATTSSITTTLLPSIPDETVFMKQLENGVAFEEDSTQGSDSDDSDDGDDMDDGGELMTPWQQMTQTFGMAKTLRPRATRRSSVSSVSQIERMSTRLTKQASMNNVLLSPKSFKQMISDYLSKHSKKVRPSGSQRGASIDGSAGRVELTQQEWLEQMLTRLDTIQCDGAPPVGGDCMAIIPTTVVGPAARPRRVWCRPALATGGRSLRPSPSRLRPPPYSSALCTSAARTAPERTAPSRRGSRRVTWRS